MDMNEIFRATQLLRSGSMKEATAVIQRALSGIQMPDMAANETTVEKDVNIIDADYRVVDDIPVSPTNKSANDDPFIERFKQFRAPFTAKNWQEYFENIPGTRAPQKQEVEPGGRFINGSYTNQTGTRSYKLYIPSCYHGQSLPLVVMLHGCTQNPDDFAAGTRMNLLAEEKHCFVVYPAQAQNSNTSKCWNWFKTTDQQRDQGEPSLIVGITREIIKAYPVNAQQVYVAGLSAGGAMAVVMGITYPDVYAAAAVHSGLPYAAAHDVPSAFAAMQGTNLPVQMQPHTTPDLGQCGRMVPTIVFHGDRDNKVNPRNAERVIAQWATIHSRTAIGAEKKPRVTMRQGRVPNGHAYTQAVYRDSTGHTILEQWQIHGSGHAWSGGSASGSYTDPQGPDATREMMRFFYEHPHAEMAERSAA